ncbi:TIGR00296 family protein [Candidatus Altiarchaeota archaeon]
MMSLSPSQGEEIVRYARKVITCNFNDDKPDVPSVLTDIFAEARGVFVTLTRHPSHELRGCIGFPEPVFPLGTAVERAALSAALDDPRFPNVTAGEMPGLLVEVSVLTKPVIVAAADPREYPSKVVVGRDGLIAEKDLARGLLLPQVPIEWGWDAEEFLSHTCTKAGLPPTAWLDRGFKLYSFTAQVFSEKTPAGQVFEKDITH